MHEHGLNFQPSVDALLIATINFNPLIWDESGSKVNSAPDIVCDLDVGIISGIAGVAHPDVHVHQGLADVPAHHRHLGDHHAPAQVHQQVGEGVAGARLRRSRVISVDGKCGILSYARERGWPDSWGNRLHWR